MSQEINLLNPALRRKRDWLGFDSVAAATGGALVVVMLAHVYAHFEAASAQRQRAALAAEVESLQRDLQAAQTTLAARKPDDSLEQEAQRLTSAVALRKETLRRAVESTAEGSVSVAEVMRGFSRHVVDGVWLTGFSVVPEGLEIRGRLIDSSLLPVYIRRLNAEPSFRGRRFAALDMRAGSDDPAAGAAAVPAPPSPAAVVVPAAVTAAAQQSPVPAMPLPFTEFALRATAVPAAAENKR